MEGDYIKLYRKMQDWEWYRDIAVSRLYLHMLLSANWKDGTYQSETVPRGSFISSRKRLSKQTGLTEREVKTAMLHLEATGEVTSKERKNYTVFTLQHYHAYQANDKETDNKETDKRQTSDMQTTTRVEGDYIKLYRKMLDWEWYTDRNTSRLYLHMLLSANWKEGRFQGETVPCGSFVSSVKNLSEETGLSEQQVKTAVKKLKSTGEITSKATTKFTVYTVLQYNVYQTSNQPITNEQPTSNQSVTTIEERKKERKEEEKQKEKVKKENAPPALEALVIQYHITESLEEKIRQWLLYKAERRETYKEQGMISLFRQIRKHADEYGESLVIELIEECMAANWKGIIWDRLQPNSGTGNHKQQKNQFNNFEQRSYDFDKLERELLRRSMVQKRRTHEMNH